MKTLRIGLCGTGNVGFAFAETIIKSNPLIKKNYGIDISLSMIGARKGKVSGLETIPVTKDIKEEPLSDIWDLSLINI